VLKEIVAEVKKQQGTMALSRSMRACLHSGRLALLAILVSGGIVLQILVSI
jgi:hypothetical protein